MEDDEIAAELVADGHQGNVEYLFEAPFQSAKHVGTFARCGTMNQRVAFKEYMFFIGALPASDGFVFGGQVDSAVGPIPSVCELFIFVFDNDQGICKFAECYCKPVDFIVGYSGVPFEATGCPVHIDNRQNTYKRQVCLLFSEIPLSLAEIVVFFEDGETFMKFRLAFLGLNRGVVGKRSVGCVDLSRTAVFGVLEMAGQPRVESFNQVGGGSHVLLLSLTAGGVGLNLVAVEITRCVLFAAIA
uniref:Uncharacterized protein n=1 Tax=Parascaris equorum TaxID=6256 RepID=A0A914S3Y3_PAREQ